MYACVCVCMYIYIYSVGFTFNRSAEFLLRDNIRAALFYVPCAETGIEREKKRGGKQGKSGSGERIKIVFLINTQMYRL